MRMITLTTPFGAKVEIDPGTVTAIRLQVHVVGAKRNIAGTIVNYGDGQSQLVQETPMDVQTMIKAEAGVI